MKRLKTYLTLLLCGCAKTAPLELSPINEEAHAPAALVAPPFKKEKALLFDPRRMPEKPGIPTEESEALLSKLYPKRLRAGEPCGAPEQKTAEEDIKSGQIRPRILTKASGAFTTQKAPQTLYIVDLDECNAPPARIGSYSTLQWVLMTNQTLTLRHQDGLRAEYLLPVDIDQDGLAEVLALNSIRMYGGNYTSGGLFSFAGERLSQVPSPNIFEQSSCTSMRGSAPEGQPAKKLSLLYLNPTGPGKPPELIEEKLSASCEEGAPYLPAP